MNHVPNGDGSLCDINYVAGRDVICPSFDFLALLSISAWGLSVASDN